MTHGVTLPELTEAYMTLANYGVHRPLTFIKSIETEDGETIYRHISYDASVFSSSTAYIVTDMLKKSVMEGTASKLRGFSYDIASKTGTAEISNDKNSDAWNVSYTTKDTLCVWYGNLSGSEEGAIKTTGGGYPTLLAATIRRSLPNPDQSIFSVPNGIVECEIDTFALKTDGNLYFSTENTPKKFREKGYFSLANMPKESSPYFSLSDIDFSIEFEKNKLLTSVRSKSPFRYKLIERDLMTGETTQYDLQPSIETHNHAKGIRSYYLAVYYESEFIGYTPNKLYFI